MNYRKLVAVAFATGLTLAACSSEGEETAGVSADQDEVDPAGVDSETENGTGQDGDGSSDQASADEEPGSEEGANDSDDSDSNSDPVAIAPGTEVTLLTHDSFSVSDGLFDNFTLETGVDVNVIQGGDAGELVARAVLTAGEPEADVLFGIDNTFLQRGLDADLFVPHKSPLLSDVPTELQLDPEYRVTPIDVGDVCVNYWIDAVGDTVPSTLDDLAEPEFASQFVTENPETSSPGFAFLLATIAKYGEDGWEDYWQKLADGGVSVTPGWSEAYYGEFIAGGGDRSLVTSYASSPVAAVLFAETPTDVAPTGVLTDSCFRQIEFAGVLAGTDQPDAAGLLVDFMLSETFQEDIPLNMFVAPANSKAVVPDLFVTHAADPGDPLSLSPAEIEANRSDWTERWAEIVLR